VLGTLERQSDPAERTQYLFIIARSGRTQHVTCTAIESNHQVRSCPSSQSAVKLLCWHQRTREPTNPPSQRIFLEQHHRDNCRRASNRRKADLLSSESVACSAYNYLRRRLSVSNLLALLLPVQTRASSSNRFNRALSEVTCRKYCKASNASSAING